MHTNESEREPGCLWGQNGQFELKWRGLHTTLPLHTLDFLNVPVPYLYLSKNFLFVTLSILIIKPLSQQSIFFNVYRHLQIMKRSSSWEASEISHFIITTHSGRHIYIPVHLKHSAVGTVLLLVKVNAISPAS